jgi:uncharacterized protein YciI
VADLYLVTRMRGPAWDFTKPRREQDGWDEHAAYMDVLADDGFVALGGPVGEGDGEEALLVVRAANEDIVRARLDEDPWSSHLLTTGSVRPWSVWVRGRPITWT